MKKYLFYVKKGLLWSLPVCIATYVTEDIIKYKDYDISTLVISIVVFVFIIGPVGGEFLQKKKHNNE